MSSSRATFCCMPDNERSGGRNRKDAVNDSDRWRRHWPSLISKATFYNRWGVAFEGKETQLTTLRLLMVAFWRRQLGGSLKVDCFLQSRDWDSVVQLATLERHRRDFYLDTSLITNWGWKLAKKKMCVFASIYLFILIGWHLCHPQAQVLYQRPGSLRVLRSILAVPRFQMLFLGFVGAPVSQSGGYYP